MSNPSRSFEPASAINRIANQYALFSITSDPRIIIDTLPGSQDAFTRIVIPAERKLEIRDKLDYINISEHDIPRAWRHQQVDRAALCPSWSFI